MDEMATAAELAVQEAKKAERRKILLMIYDCVKNGENLEDLAEKLKAMDAETT